MVLVCYFEHSQHRRFSILWTDFVHSSSKLNIENCVVLQTRQMKYTSYQICQSDAILCNVCLHSAVEKRFLCHLWGQRVDCLAHASEKNDIGFNPNDLTDTAKWRQLSHTQEHHWIQNTLGCFFFYFQLILAYSHICIPLQSHKLNLFDWFFPYMELLQIEKWETWVSLL